MITAVVPISAHAAGDTELLSLLLVCEGLTRRIDAISTTAIGPWTTKGRS